MFVSEKTPNGKMKTTATVTASAAAKHEII